MQDRNPALPHRRYLDRRIVGTPAEVASQVAILRDTNRLVAMSKPRQMPDGDQRVWVSVTFLDRTQPAATVVRVRRRRWPVVAGVVSVGVAVLGVAAYALIQLVNAVIAALPYIGGALLLLALVALLTGGRASRVACVTFHGPNCRHH